MPLVSVIMPAYNQQRYIAQSIESVLKQTFKDWELIIVNDGSTDDTIAIIKRYVMENDGRVRLINKPQNEGVASGLNDGLKSANGRYIGWLSSDDLFCENTIDKQVRFLENNSRYDVAFGGFELINGVSEYISTHLFDFAGDVKKIYRELLKRCYIHGCTMIVKKSCYDEIGYFDNKYKYAQDYDMWLRLASKYEFGYIPDVLVKGRIHDAQFTKLGQNEVDAIKVMANFLTLNSNAEQLLVKAGLGSSWKGFLHAWTSFSDGYPQRTEIQALLEGLKSFLHHFNLPNERTSGFERLQRRLELILENPALPNSKFFDEQSEGNYLEKLCSILDLDGFIINREAVRFNQYEANNFETIMKGLPHPNTVVKVKMPLNEFSTLIDRNHDRIYHYCREVKQGHLIIGISSYMLSDNYYAPQLIGYEHLDTGEYIRKLVLDTAIENYLRD